MWDLIKSIIVPYVGEIITFGASALTAWIIRMLEKKRMKDKADGNQ